MNGTSVQDKIASSYDALKAQFGYTNLLQSPRLVKVVISSGTGKKARFEKGVHELVADRLGKITGQKAAAKQAKKSVAGFKVREGDVVGQMVTLRGQNMMAFLNKLIHVAFPRTKDFRGLPTTSIDQMGNMTLGIKEHTIFPECSEEDLKDVFGMAITVVTTAKSKDQARAFFDHLGFPFKKEEDAPKKKRVATNFKKK